MIEVIWWHWAVFGFTLLVVDILLTNTTVLLWFGASAIIVALLLFIISSLPVAFQVFLFGAIAFGLLAFWKKVLEPKQTQKLFLEAQDRLPNVTAVMIRFHDGKGQIRLQAPIGGKDVWDCCYEGDIKPGSRVKILSVRDDGQVVIEPHTTT